MDASIGHGRGAGMAEQPITSRATHSQMRCQRRGTSLTTRENSTSEKSEVEKRARSASVGMVITPVMVMPRPMVMMVPPVGLSRSRSRRQREQAKRKNDPLHGACSPLPVPMMGECADQT